MSPRISAMCAIVSTGGLVPKMQYHTAKRVADRTFTTTTTTTTTVDPRLTIRREERLGNIQIRWILNLSMHLTFHIHIITHINKNTKVACFFGLP